MLCLELERGGEQRASDLWGLVLCGVGAGGV